MENKSQLLCKDNNDILSKFSEEDLKALDSLDEPIVQDVIYKEFYEEEEKEKDTGNNEMLELLYFIQESGVPLKSEQVEAMFLMQEMGVGDIAKFMVDMKPKVTPVQRFFDLINKITLADRIKGNAKLSGLVKAQVASANGVMPEMQKHMREQQRIAREMN